MTAKTPSSTGQEMGRRATMPSYRRAIPFAIVAATLVLCLLVYIIYRIQTAPLSPIQIAVVVPLSGPLEHRGKEALDAVHLYFDEVNRQGGVRGHPIEVIPYDDADKPEIASAKAHEVAASQALVVMGHFTSPASLAGGKVYRDYPGDYRVCHRAGYHCWQSVLFSGRDRKLRPGPYAGSVRQRCSRPAASADYLQR